MVHPFHTPFFTVFRTEVLLNLRRVAPYFMALLCGGNALLWWGWGPAYRTGLATHSEAFISGVLPIYSFMTLPLFTAVIMADPVIRDFRAEIGPLIFSKPVGRFIYLLGKFFGSFFVLACGQAAFVVTLFVLQWFNRPGVTQQGVTVVPYFKHFLVFVVISHLVLGCLLLCRRYAYSQCQNRICPRSLFLSAHHQLQPFLLERSAIALGTNARSASHEMGPKK